MFGHEVAHWTEMWIIIPYSAYGPSLEGATSIRRSYSSRFQNVEMLREYGFEIEWKTVGYSGTVQVSKVVDVSSISLARVMADIVSVMAALVVIGSCTAYTLDALASADYSAGFQQTHPPRQCLIFMTAGCTGCVVMEMGRVVEAVWAVVGSVVGALSNAVETRKKAETLATAEAAEEEAAAAARIVLKQYPEPFLLSLPSLSKRWAAELWAAGGAIIQLPPGLQTMAEPSRLCSEFQQGKCRLGGNCPLRHIVLSANEEEHGGRSAAAQRAGVPAVEAGTVTQVLSPRGTVARGTVALAQAASAARSQSQPGKAATPAPRGVMSTPPPPVKEPPPRAGVAAFVGAVQG